MIDPMGDWRDRLNGDPLPWLLDEAAPAVRHRALRELLGHPVDDPEVDAARLAAMGADPIAAILDAQDPEGWWTKPGGGYSPKYTGTVWSLVFLDQLGADGADPRIRRACEYLLDHTQAPDGGFGWSGGVRKPADSTVAHCLNGNLLRALIGPHIFGVSFGGMVTQVFAIRYPERVNKLVLSATSSGGKGGSSYPLHEISHLSFEEQARIMIPVVDTRLGVEWQKNNPEKYEALIKSRLESSRYRKEPEQAAALMRQFEARKNHNTFDRLHTLNMPVYICGGKYDGLCKPENLKALQRVIPGSKLEWFEGGHLCLRQDPEAYERIAEFLLES